MMSNRVPSDVVEVQASELRHDLRTWLERVAYDGDELVILRAGKPIAALVSLEALAALRRLVAPHEDAADLEAARAASKAGDFVPLAEALRKMDASGDGA